ncbi:MAG: ABC transporter permease [Actinomycetaceae bacterium]|nr:ABC transporter permease [Actinomycetaceae bacterium]
MKPSSAVLRAALIQAKVELRPYFTGPSLIALVAMPISLSLVVFFIGINEVQIDGWGPIMFVGAAATMATMLPMQLTSEFYTDRVTGALFRLRILPHGTLSWSIGKTISQFVLFCLPQLLVLIVGALFFPTSLSSPGKIAGLILVAVFSAAACAPLGFILGSQVRGMYSLAFFSIVLLTLFVTSGGFFPITTLSLFVQIIHLVFPFYWAGHLARWVLLDSPAPQYEFGGSSQPLIAIAILLAWLIVGFAVASVVVRHSFRTESLSTLEKMRRAFKSESGLYING